MNPLACIVTAKYAAIDHVQASAGETIEGTAVGCLVVFKRTLFKRAYFFCTGNERNGATDRSSVSRKRCSTDKEMARRRYEHRAPTTVGGVGKERRGPRKTDDQTL